MDCLRAGKVDSWLVPGLSRSSSIWANEENARAILLCLMVSISSVTISQYAFAYRPFISTDAAVADKGELEIELGLFELIREKGKNEIIVPSLRLNYGILNNWEIVGEFDVQVFKEGEERNLELKEPSLFLKGILREGILQNKEGPSFAIEFGVLFSSTVVEERKSGLEGIAILSGNISDLFIYHLNVGGELDRENFDPNGIWGTIIEYRYEGRFRLVGEINGTIEHSGEHEVFGLIGFIWDVREVKIDFGVRKGLSEAASDWELTTGVTFSF